MKICWARFNTYLATGLVLSLLCGCNTEKSKKTHLVSTFRLHQEAKFDPTGKTEEAVVFREHPIKLNVDREPFLTEKHVKAAKVVDSLGGFALSIEFDQQGSWLLEEYSAATRGKHIAIYSQFIGPTEEKLNPGRWLAAPKMQARITDGLLVFTPDATREETDRIAQGLNNVAKKLETGQEIKF